MPGGPPPEETPNSTVINAIYGNNAFAPNAETEEDEINKKFKSLKSLMINKESFRAFQNFNRTGLSPQKLQIKVSKKLTEALKATPATLIMGSRVLAMPEKKHRATGFETVLPPDAFTGGGRGSKKGTKILGNSRRGSVATSSTNNTTANNA